MNKENNRSAAGLRRSAIAERIRLREEWSELKGTPDVPLTTNKQSVKVLIRKPQTVSKNAVLRPNVYNMGTKRTIGNISVAKSVQMSSEVLVGVVALVEVGAETRALALRAALTALGASVVPSWSPIVTHVIWAQGGCRATRAKARALASRLVSPLWVEACAASNTRLPEQAFPAAARASDLPSPRTLRQLLKKAELENISLLDLLSDKNEDKVPRLRLSSETDMDTSNDTSRDQSRDTSSDQSRDTLRDESRNTSKDESKDTSRDETKDTSRDESKNTSRDTTKNSTGNDTDVRVNTAPRRALPVSVSPAPVVPAKSRRKLFTNQEGLDATSQNGDESDAKPKPVRPSPLRVRVRERKELARAERMARKLVKEALPKPTTANTTTTARPRIVLTGMGRIERQGVTAAVRAMGGRLQANVNWKTTHVLLGSCTEHPDRIHNTGIPSSHNISGVGSLTSVRSGSTKARTLSALEGAVRGCRVLLAAWAVDSAKANTWLHHHGYEVPHLKKISMKARIERAALAIRGDYAYDVFYGLKIRVNPPSGAAYRLLQLCGATVCPDGEVDLNLGPGDGEVSTKWVFDSVAAGRMRTTRRYANVCDRSL